MSRIRGSRRLAGAGVALTFPDLDERQARQAAFEAILRRWIAHV